MDTNRSTWRSHLKATLEEVSDIEFQKNLWLNLFPKENHMIGSYEDLVSDYFDGMNVTDLKEQLSDGIISLQEYELLTPFNTLFNEFVSSSGNDFDYGNPELFWSNPKWKELSLYAKNLLQSIDF